MRDLPGYELFQYVDEDGETRAVDSADVNAYLKSIAGEEFTTTSRTWAGTVLAAEALSECGPKNGLSHHRARSAPTRQHQGGVPQVLHPPCGDRCVRRRHPRGAMTSRSVEACVVRLLARGRRRGSLVPALKKSLSRLRRRPTAKGFPSCSSRLAPPCRSLLQPPRSRRPSLIAAERPADPDPEHSDAGNTSDPRWPAAALGSSRWADSTRAKT